LSVPLRNRFFQILNTELHNLYGPTEAAVDVTHWACHRDDDGRSVPIGRPIANTQIHILDRHMNPVPIGIAGELHIGGVGLARGYLNNPVLTEEKFVPSPFGEKAGARLYKTGDLARYWADGTIEYLGRMDTQIKLRGFRVELGEIEAVLRQHSGVQQTVVVVREDTRGDPRLVAYLVGSGPVVFEPSELRDLLKQTLPDHMVPAAFVQLPALPLTANGKVDRKALPVPRASVLSDSVSRPAPYNEVEKKIALIWQDILGVATVGRDNSFFDLGGHSLLLARANIRLRQAFNKDITMLDMFRFATVRTLATHLTDVADSNVANARQPADGVRADGLRRRRQTRRHSAKELVKEPS
jgi:acyl carrier protein